MTDLVIVLSTVSDDARAEELARTLVDERLAACVHLHAPATSFYRWKGRLERDTERPIAIKTTADRLDALRERFNALHPYELPEFVVIRADEGSEAYVKWVREQTR
jgi:periplasmic divalent cation tolerance protein